MDDSDRAILLDKIDRDSLTLGASIPEEMEVKGNIVPLEKVVFEVCSDGEIPESFEMDIEGFKRVLRREMNDCIDSIENDDITYQEGRERVEKVSQIQRALNVLESHEGDVDLEKESELSDAQDTKRWRKFVEKVRGE